MSRRDAVETWEAHATRYARQESLEHRAIAAVARLAEAGPGDRLLDIGTGTGLVLRALAAAGPGRRPRTALGIDASAAMLAQLDPAALPEGWTVARGDARALPVPDASADLVTCAYVLHLLDGPDRTAVLREVRRVLVPGGRVVVATPWSPRAGVRLALTAIAAAAPARLGGLTPWHPAPALRAAALTPTAEVVLPRRGYPTVVVRADDLRGVG